MGCAWINVYVTTARVGEGTQIYIIVDVHMLDQRNAKKGCFFKAKCDSQQSQLGIKMCLFQENRSFLDSIRGSKGNFSNVTPNILFPG